MTAAALTGLGCLAIYLALLRDLLRRHHSVDKRQARFRGAARHA
jgi:hypothetical protein